MLHNASCYKLDWTIWHIDIFDNMFILSDLRHRIEINRKATRVGTFEVCVSLRMFIMQVLASNCLFWPIGTLNWPFRHYSGQSIA